MLKILPILLLVAIAHCQNNEDLIVMLVQTYGPTQTVASNQVHEKPLSQDPIVPSVQTGTGGTDDVLACTMPDGQSGQCVSYHHCRNNDVNVKNGSNRVIDLDSNRKVCPSYLDICCQPSDIILSNLPMKPLNEPAQQQRQGCGWANPNGVNMQSQRNGNKYANFGEFPWVVAILKTEAMNYDEPRVGPNIYVGGGSLIHPSVVLTVAHYATGAKALKVRAGEWDTTATTEVYPFQERDVVSVETHKDFNKDNFFYDIAVLFLDKPMDLAPNVGVACLPPARIRQSENTRCIATGWGKDKFSREARYQVILKKIELPVVKHDDCQAALRRTRLGNNFILHSSFMCAGGEPGKDTCTGDGGAPLSCPIEYEKDRYVQNGIVTWGIGCGEDGTPGVYVDVSVLRDWIDDKVAGKGYDPTTYSY